MRAPRASGVSFAWPAGATHLAPATMRAIYAGDTVHAHALLGDMAGPGHVALEFATEDGVRHRQRVELSGPVAEGTEGRPSTVARLAAAARLASLPEEEATELALAHQLLSPYTSWIVVDERAAADRTDGMPALRPVPHMMAAGWGGLGVASSRVAMCVSPAFSDAMMPSLGMSESAPPSLRKAALFAPPTRRQSIRALVMRRRSKADPREILQAAGLDDELSRLLAQARSPFVAEIVANAFAAALLAGMEGEDPRLDGIARGFARQMKAMMDRLREIEHLAVRFARAAAEIDPQLQGVLTPAIDETLETSRHAQHLAAIARHGAIALHARLDEPLG
jgi:hypothetical protein